MLKLQSGSRMAVIKGALAKIECHQTSLKVDLNSTPMTSFWAIPQQGTENKLQTRKNITL